MIPAYKQEKTIKKDVLTIYKALKSSRFRFEILVVVDGFVDSTYGALKSIKLKGLKVLGYEQNKGKGFAVKYGMLHARGDIIGFLDAGMEIDANGISMVLEHMQWYNADIIVASKRHPVSKVDYPLIRKIYSWGYYLLILFLFRVRVRDTQTGLKMFKRDVLRAVLPRTVVKQYAFDIELLAVSSYLGFRRIYEAPVYLRHKFESGSRFGVLFIFDPFIRNMLLDTLAIFYRMHFLKFYADSSWRLWSKISTYNG